MLDSNTKDVELAVDGYVTEVVDIYGKRLALEYSKDEYQEAHSYAQYNSSFDTIDYVMLYSGNGDETLVFEDGFLVKR